MNSRFVELLRDVLTFKPLDVSKYQFSALFFVVCIGILSLISTLTAVFLTGNFAGRYLFFVCWNVLDVFGFAWFFRWRLKLPWPPFALAGIIVMANLLQVLHPVFSSFPEPIRTVALFGLTFWSVLAVIRGIASATKASRAQVFWAFLLYVLLVSLLWGVFLSVAQYLGVQLDISTLVDLPPESVPNLDSQSHRALDQ